MSPTRRALTRRRPSLVAGRAIALVLVLLGGLGWWQPATVRAASFVVTTAADSGAGSLRQAIDDANVTAGADTITFSLGSAAPIRPLTELPGITDVVVIDGTGAFPVTIDGSLLTGGENGLVVTGPGANLTEIRDLGVVGFPASGILLNSVASVVISGTWIGTDTVGAAPNVTGITVGPGSSAVKIGGPAAGSGNLVAGNTGAGILVAGPGVDDVLIRGNGIGMTDAGLAIPNGTGVRVAGGGEGFIGGVVIGGPAAGDGNLVAGNTGDGIEVVGFGVIGVDIAANEIRDNGGLGIDLGANGVTANDAGDGDGGPNLLQNFPVISSTGPTDVAGTLDAEPGTYRLELYANAACDPSGNGEGAQLLKVATGQAPGAFGFDVPVINGTYLTVTATNEATGATSEFSPCFLATNALPAPGTWAGAQASINPSDLPIPTAGTFLAAGAGPGGSSQFTYTIPVTSADGEAGAWSFYTTAASSGTVVLPWRWTGNHAFFQVTARLDAVVVRDGDTLVSAANLVNAGPADCCSPPSSGFDYTGSASFAVQAGDVYGFVIHGSNFDSNDFLQGELTVGTQVPTSCANAQTVNAATVDGTYVINPIGGQRYRVHCDSMEATGKTYLEVRSGPGRNFSSYAAGGASPGTDVVTSFTKLRFDPATLRVDVGDLTFATSSGSLTHSALSDPHAVTSMPYGVAMACTSGEGSNGTANVDLQGTPFAVDDTWIADGTGSEFYGGEVYLPDDQVVNISANGFCGWRTPDPATSFYVWETEAGQASLQLRYLSEPPVVTLSTPVLFASVTTSPDVADLYGRVDGASNTTIDLEIHASAACVAGVLADGAPVIGSATVTTDAEGYFKVESQTGLPSGTFVSVHVTSPAVTGLSSCIRTSANNDYWPKALTLTGDTASQQDVIDVAGKSRWYRFPIVPGQRITVSLTGLPADYDLTVYRDIAAEFERQLVPEDTTELTRLSAEFAPSAYAPQVFSPQVFSPQVFSPDAYAPQVFSPQVFSPQVFSPQVFSPQVFSPQVFSPQVFSPQVFSPQVFSPQVFSPQVFSPQVFSPQVFSPDEILQAFSSAQTRSLIGVSAQTGPGDESVVVNSWNNTGAFFVRVAGRSGVFDADGLFTVSVSKSVSTCAGITDTELTPRLPAPAAGVKTVILTDSSELALGSASTPGTLANKLAAFAARTEVAGALVDVASDARVQELKVQADANRACPFATNLLAEEIKGIVDSYRANNPDLRYVTVIGGDTVIPFFRYPDQTMLGQESGFYPPVKSDSISEASLRQDFVLSQDAYGSGIAVTIRSNSFPVPGLAVGRLVETPDEIGGLLDAYTAANGTLVPETSLVTGYDFLEDAANGVRDELAAGTGTAPATLITPNGLSPQDPASWTADQLRTALFNGAGHDLVFLAGHFSANSALAADFVTSIVTTELEATSTDFLNSIVFSAGCHSGYNLLDDEALPGASLALDWAQAFSRKRAILIAGTGYQYGDTDFLEYSERLYRDFARELRAGEIGTPVTVGEALRNAKLGYLATTPDIRGLHEKSLLEAALFGLPMWGVDMDGLRTGVPPAGTGVTPVPAAEGTPGGDLGLATAGLSVNPGLGPRQTVDLVNEPYTDLDDTTQASWYEGQGGAVTTNPAEPTLPLVVRNVTSTNGAYVLRGIGFRGATYVDTAGIVPLTGAPTTELRGVHAPFVSPVFFPMRLWTANYFGALGGRGGTNLLATPVQYRSDPAAPGTTIERKFTDVDVRLFYSSNLTSAALSEAPTIVSVQSLPDGDDLVFEAQVVGDPKAAISEVWVTWTTGAGPWQSLDLVQCVAPAGGSLPAACGTTADSRLWRARLVNAPAGVSYIVQAANGLGMVSLNDNLGAYYSTGPAAPAPAATTLAITSAPSTGVFGSSVPVSITLTEGTAGVVGAQVFVTLGGATVLATTGTGGTATVGVPLNSLPGTTALRASFSGDATRAGSSTQALPFTITKAPATLSLAAAATPATIGPSGTTVTATLASGATPLIQRSVVFLVTPPGGPTTVTFSTTDYLGRARLQIPTTVVGDTVVEARFGSVVTLPPPDGGVQDLTDSTYGPASASLTQGVRWPFTGFFSPVDNLPTLNTATAGQTIPVKFSLGGDRGLLIFRAGYPKAVPIACPGSSAPVDAIEETVSTSGLTYDAATNRYQYNWKTVKSTMAGKCWQLQLGLKDGNTVPVANFKLK